MTMVKNRMAVALQEDSHTIPEMDWRMPAWAHHSAAAHRLLMIMEMSPDREVLMLAWDPSPRIIRMVIRRHWVPVSQIIVIRWLWILDQLCLADILERAAAAIS